MKEEKSWMIEMEKGFRGTAMMQNDKKITPDGQSSVCTDLSALFEDARAMNLTKRANEELGYTAAWQELPASPEELCVPSHNCVRCYLQQGGGVNRAPQEIPSSPEGSFTRTNNSSK